MSKGVRNVFGIIALVFSGFFLYGVNLVAFINQPAWPIKTIVIAVFGIPAIVFLLIGVFCHGFNKFRRDLGIVLLSAAGMTALVILSFICMLAPPDMLRMFSAVLSGVVCLSLYIVLGLGLLFTLRKRA
jgi:hypothetical protein